METYSNLFLLLFGMLGMLFYIFMKVKKINDKTEGKFRFGNFLSLEWPSMILSFLTIIIFIIAKTEIQQLDAVSKYLGLAFVFIGYGGQSALYAFFSRTEKKLNAGIDPTKISPPVTKTITDESPEQETGEEKQP